MFLHENANRYGVTLEAIRNAESDIFNHLPNSQDLAPSDLHLFPKLTELIRGIKFNDNDA